MECGKQPYQEASSQIGRVLALSETETVALALPDVKEVYVDTKSKNPDGSGGSFHELPDEYPNVEFVVCTETDVRDETMFQRYREAMTVWATASIDRLTVVTETEVFVADGTVVDDEVVAHDVPSLCSHSEDSVKDCVNLLFDIIDASFTTPPATER